MMYIKIFDKYVPVLISPKELEDLHTIKTYKNGHIKISYFIQDDPYQTIRRLCETYSLEYDLKKYPKENDNKATLDIPGLRLFIESEGKSMRLALRNVANKLHYEYFKRIQDVDVPIIL